MAQQSETQYLFMSKPHAVNNDRPKYREPEEIQDDVAAASNLMWDARVVRGKTCGKPIQFSTSRYQYSTEPYTKSSSQHRKENRQRKERLVRRGIIRPTAPSVSQIHAAISVPKSRVEVPLHLYLTEQEEKVQVHNLHAQTDAFVQEAEDLAPPVYIPRKTGVDIATQVDHEMVFKYDDDVKPILQTVISKTLEQAMMEVQQEEELEFMRRRMIGMINKRKNDKEEQKAREQKERDLRKAMELKLGKARERYTKELDVKKKIASRILAKKFLSRLEKNVNERLTEKHYFYDPLSDQINQFIPWLVENLCSKLANSSAADGKLEELIGLSIKKLSEQRAAALQTAQQRKEEEQERKKKIKEAADVRRRRRTIMELLLTCDEIDQSPIGPLQLSGQNTLEDLQTMAFRWLTKKMDTPPDVKAVKYIFKGKELIEPDIILHELGLEDLQQNLKIYIEIPPPAVSVDDNSESADQDD